jgi:hypothetical protein
MGDKICPIRSPWNDIEGNTHEPACIRERCAWWSKSNHEELDGGMCAIKGIALELLLTRYQNEKNR